MEQFSAAYLMQAIKDIKNDAALNTLLSELSDISDHTKSVLNGEKIVSEQIDDCFIPLMSLSTFEGPVPYSKFIKKVYPDSIERSDTKERRSWKRFFDSLETLREQYKDAGYIPPFIHYICQSIQPSQDSDSIRRKEKYRNYDYLLFSAPAYSYIMRNYGCFPYWYEDRGLSIKQCKSFLDFFIGTKDYGAMHEKLTGLYFIDFFFSIGLFADILYALSSESGSMDIRPYFSSAADYKCYLEYFLFLCSLLQNSSGIGAKYHLFDRFCQIFLNPGKSDYIKLFKSPEACFKQCAFEVTFYNEIVYPYVRSLYLGKFEKFLLKEGPAGKHLHNHSLTREEFTSILELHRQTEDFNQFVSRRIECLEHIRSDLEYMDTAVLSHVLDKFYHFSPLTTGKMFKGYALSYSTIRQQLMPFIDIKFLDIKRQFL